jgi:hypothetical protein
MRGNGSEPLLLAEIGLHAQENIWSGGGMIVHTSESALRNVIGALDARCEVARVEVTRFSAPQAA